MEKLDFSNAAASKTSSYTVVEPKICHRCGVGFFRPVPQDAKHGLKFCANCVSWFMKLSRVQGKSIQ
jgi:hypothetical protein